MEDTLRGKKLCTRDNRRVEVLILVLMEDTLRDEVLTGNEKFYQVLILVLMEDTLRVAPATGHPNCIRES